MYFNLLDHASVPYTKSGSLLWTHENEYWTISEEQDSNARLSIVYQDEPYAIRISSNDSLSEEDLEFVERCIQKHIPTKLYSDSIIDPLLIRVGLVERLHRPQIKTLKRDLDRIAGGNDVFWVDTILLQDKFVSMGDGDLITDKIGYQPDFVVPSETDTSG